MRPFIHILALLLLAGFENVLAQAKPDFYDRTGNFSFGGGTSMPGEALKSGGPNGLFAQNGHQVNFGFTYTFFKGLGAGAHIDIVRFGFDHDQFVRYAQPEAWRVRGKYGGSRFGVHLGYYLPVVIDEKHFTAVLFGEGHAGFRGMNIPDIDLQYGEYQNRYVTVEYRRRSNTFGYLGYKAGVLFVINNRFGVSAAYMATLRSRHSMPYNVRKLDAFGNLYEAENYLHNYQDYTGLQFAVSFTLGKK
jgi:hypothetical protein